MNMGDLLARFSVIFKIGLSLTICYSSFVVNIVGDNCLMRIIYSDGAVSIIKIVHFLIRLTMEGGSPIKMISYTLPPSQFI